MCPLSTVTCSALLSHTAFFLVNTATKINQRSGLGFLLCFCFGYFAVHSYLADFLSSCVPPCPSYPCRWISIGGSSWCAFSTVWSWPHWQQSPCCGCGKCPTVPCCAPVWCFLPCLSLCGDAHKARHPPCQNCSQRVGNGIPGVETGSSLFHACAQGECVRKQQVKYSNSDLSQWAPCASWCTRLSGCWNQYLQNELPLFTFPNKASISIFL